MILATPGFVLHTTPYSEASVVAKVFTRQLGMRSYLIKGVRSSRGRVKQNLLQPLSCVDMVVYDNPKNDLNYIKELAPRHPESTAPQTSSRSATFNALRFFMTEVLYKSLREEEPMPELFDYVESVFSEPYPGDGETKHLPIMILLTVARHLGIEPMDNYSVREPLFDLQEGRFVASLTDTTLPPALSSHLHEYLCNLSMSRPISVSMLSDRRSLIDALLAYFQLHLSSFRNFYSHEILHTILK